MINETHRPDNSGGTEQYRDRLVEGWHLCVGEASGLASARSPDGHYMWLDAGLNLCVEMVGAYTKTVPLQIVQALAVFQAEYAAERGWSLPCVATDGEG